MRAEIDLKTASSASGGDAAVVILSRVDPPLRKLYSPSLRREVYCFCFKSAIFTIKIHGWRDRADAQFSVISGTNDTHYMGTCSSYNSSPTHQYALIHSLFLANSTCRCGNVHISKILKTMSVHSPCTLHGNS